MNEAPPSEQGFFIDMEFKPVEPGLKLRPAETQLLLAHIGEILEEIETEERLIIKEEKRAAQEVTFRKSKDRDRSCK